MMLVSFMFDSGRFHAVEMIIATMQGNKIDERDCFKLIKVKQKGIPQVWQLTIDVV